MYVAMFCYNFQTLTFIIVLSHLSLSSTNYFLKLDQVTCVWSFYLSVLLSAASL